MVEHILDYLGVMKMPYVKFCILYSHETAYELVLQNEKRKSGSTGPIAA